MQDETTPYKAPDEVFAHQQESLPALISTLNTFAKEMIALVSNLTDQNRAENLLDIWNSLIRARNLLTFWYRKDETLKQAVHNVLQYNLNEDNTQIIELTCEGKKYVFRHDYNGPKQVVTVNIRSYDQHVTGQPSSLNPEPAGPSGDGGSGPPPPPAQ